MIQVESVLIANQGIDAVWRFVSEIQSMAPCVPTVLRYEMEDADTVNCSLRLRLGVIPLDGKARVSITKREQNRSIELQGRTEAGESLKKFGKLTKETYADLRIVIELEAVEPSATRIHFRLQAQATGQLKRIYDAIINHQRLKLEKQFGERLAKGLNASISIQPVRENFASAPPSMREEAGNGV